MAGRILPILLMLVTMLGLGGNLSLGQAELYQHSYALVIGIDQYPHAPSQLKDLKYAVKDAEGMATLLTNQGFDVTSLLNEQANREGIIGELTKYARKVGERDRFLMFFAGHGVTETYGGKDYGYIVPYDGKNFSNYIGMDSLQDWSEKMHLAKHQLFIMDACYGGLAAIRSSASGVSLEHPPVH